MNTSQQQNSAKGKDEQAEKEESSDDLMGIMDFIQPDGMDDVFAEMGV